jgi:hypothetical protein
VIHRISLCKARQCEGCGDRKSGKGEGAQAHRIGSFAESERSLRTARSGMPIGMSANVETARQQKRVRQMTVSTCWLG